MRDGLYKREGSPYWYALIWIDGTRFRRCTETTSKTEARHKREEIRASLIAELRKERQFNGVTWLDACIKWLNDKERSTTDRYILRALQYENRLLADCTPESFEPALSHLNRSTYNRYRSIIQAVCNLSGHKLKLPLKKVKRARLRILSHEEWDRLYAELPAHLKPLAAFSIQTGMRQHNVTHLRWDQINLPARIAWVHADQAKGNKSIGVHLSDQAIAILEAQAGLSKEWVFPYKGRGKKAGTPITKVKTAWQMAMERAGLGRFEYRTDEAGKAHKKWHGDFTWHGLRHTWASWHLMAGTPIEVLAKLGGWDDLRMVQEHYGHLSNGHLARYANNAVPWSVVKTTTKNSHSASVS